LTQGEQRRRLKLNIEDLVEAFDTDFFDLSTYLDLETGELVSVTTDVESELGRIYEELAPNSPIDVVSVAEVQKLVDQSDLPDWIREAVVVAAEVDHGLGTRFIEVPARDPRDGYEDIQAFIATVGSPDLQEWLFEVIRGRGAFRRFKDVLARYPKEQERWYGFQNAQLRARVLEWLESESIDPIVNG
jgi:Uncharacterised protein family (UPF0158)